MTQVKSAQRAGKKVASTLHARHRTLAQRRADLETQIRASLAADATLALTEPSQVKLRMKQLRKLAGKKQHEVASETGTPPRTFQSWEDAEVETDRENYERIAAYYSKKIGRPVTANWILFGHDEAPPLATPDLSATVDGDMPDDLRQQVHDLHVKVDRIIDALGIDENADQHPLDQISDLAEALPELLAGNAATATSTGTGTAGS